MDSSDYIEVKVSIDPFSEENAEILEAMLSDLPYDSFVIGESDVKCYIQKPQFDRFALKAVLSGMPFKTSFEAAPVPFHLECTVGECFSADCRGWQGNHKAG